MDPHPERGPGVRDTVPELADIRRDDPRRGARRRRPHVRGEVRDRDVRLVAHGADHGRGEGDDRPRDPLVVEGPQVLEGPAAAGEDRDVHPARNPPERRRDRRGRVVPLDEARTHKDLRERVPPAEDCKDVVHRGPRLRRDEPDAAREPGQRSLPARVEEPLRGEAVADLLEGQPERPVADRAQLPHDELDLAPGGEHVHVAAGDDLDPVPQLEPHRGRGGPEEDARDLGGRVLQGEVCDAGGRAGDVPDLASDEDVRERGVAGDRGPQDPDELGHGERVLRHAERLQRLHRSSPPARAARPI